MRFARLGPGDAVHVHEPLGRRISDAAVLLGALLFPLEGLIQGHAWQLLVAMGVALLLTAGAFAIAPALFAEVFPTGIRAVGFGVSYPLAIALFSGTAPYLKAYVDQRHATGASYWWVSHWSPFPR